MRIITINVNGIRAAERKGFFNWLKKQNADVVCLQEIKAQEDQLDERFYPDDMHTYYHPAERKGYSGTGLYCKSKPDKISYSPWEDMNSEGRIIQADFADLSVLSIYLPSGSSKEERQALKMEFIYDRFLPHLRELKKDNRRYVICGDWNIAHKKIDLKNWRSNQKNSGFLPEERAWLDILYDDLGYIDSFREAHPDPTQTLEGTWGYLSPREIISDRIDFVYYKGQNLKTISSKIVMEDPEGGFFNSDHRAILTQFELKN